MTLYDRISALCEERGIKGGKMCSDLGISKSLMTDLKKGRKNGVTATTAQKIASYFDVSVGYLLGEEDTYLCEDTQLIIGDRIRDRRKAINMSVEELAGKIGKDRATVYRYESGKIENMPIGLLNPIAQALDVSIEYLIGADTPRDQVHAPQTDILEIIIRLHKDSNFRGIVEKISNLDSERLTALQQFLMAFGDK